MIRNIALAVLLTFLTQISFAQLPEGDSLLLEARYRAVYDHYQDLGVAPLLSGKGYHPDYRYAINSPYFGSEGLEWGTLEYDGVFYREIELQYDLHSQQLVVQRETRNDAQLIILDTDKVEAFTIRHYRFVGISGDSTLSNGIYQLLHQSNTSSLLARKTMDMKEEATHTDISVEFKPKSRYFIRNTTGTYTITSRKSLLTAYSHVPTIKTLIKKSNVRFSKNLIEQSLINFMTTTEQTLTAN